MEQMVTKMEQGKKIITLTAFFLLPALDDFSLINSTAQHTTPAVKDSLSFFLLLKDLDSIALVCIFYLYLVSDILIGEASHASYALVLVITFI